MSEISPDDMLSIQDALSRWPGRDTTSWYEHHDPEWLRDARIATDKIILRIDALLKKRTITSRISHGRGNEPYSGPKVVVSNDR